MEKSWSDTEFIQMDFLQGFTQPNGEMKLWPPVALLSNNTVLAAFSQMVVRITSE